MKIYLAVLLLLIGGGSDAVISSARDAYEQGKFEESIQRFSEALDRYPDKSAQLNYNIAQCYMQLNRSDSANYYFQLVLGSVDPKLASKAANNIGVIQADLQQLNFALNSFKEALLRDPYNENARYNFELVRRQKQNLPPPPSQNEPPKEDPPEGKERQSPPPPPRMNNQELQRLLDQIRKKMKKRRPNHDLPIAFGDTLTEAEAFAVMEALQSQDPQFVQQLRKVVRSSSRKKRNKRPDW